MSFAGSSYDEIRAHARRESEVALLVIVTTTLYALSGLTGPAIAAPSLIFPAAAFAIHGHIVGRRAATACVSVGISGLLLVVGSESIRPTEATVPALLGIVAWGVSAGVERSGAARRAFPAAPRGRWMTVEVETKDEPETLPMTTPATLVTGYDLHVRIARRRRFAPAARRA